MKNPFIYATILLGIYILYLTECSGDSSDKMDRDTTIVIILDTGTTISNYYPTIINETPGPIPEKVDTPFVIGDYYAIRSYSDTSFEENNYRVIADGVVSQNRLTSMKLRVQNLRPTTVINPTETIPPKLKVFFGGNINVGIGKFGAGPSVAILTKRESLFSYSFDALNQTHSGSIYFKLRLRK